MKTKSMFLVCRIAPCGFSINSERVEISGKGEEVLGIRGRGLTFPEDALSAKPCHILDTIRLLKYK